MTVASASREQVTRTLRDVFDPELGMSVVDLGLIYGVEIDGAGVRITMTLTTQGCPLHDSMTDWIRQAVGKIPGVEDVQVAIVFDPPWTPDRIRPGTSPRPFALRRVAAQPGTSLPCALMSPPMKGLIPGPLRRPHPGDKTRRRPGVLNLDVAVGALRLSAHAGGPMEPERGATWSLARTLAWVVLAVIAGALAYTGWIAIVNFNRIGV